ncbi:MAG TPA: ATP-dependent DNA ligase [Steroidobacteraceae bacterium]|nr:ATP-dependent DNA ligase [Steroidobacteraceae bacterium]
MTLLAELVQTSEHIAATAARLGKVQTLAAYLRTLEPDEIEIAVHFLSGSIPQGRIGIGYALLEDAAAAHATRATLSLQGVNSALAEITATQGAGAAARRRSLLRSLLARATPGEQSFLARLLVGELRQGALEGVMIEAIAAAAGQPVADVRRAAMYVPGLGALARVALLEGAEALGGRVRLELFSPVAPMLAQTASDTGEALELLGGTAAFEWKMDGARIQVHKAGAEVRVYTRALNEVTGSVPEIVAAVCAFTSETLVLDGEAIALDRLGRPQPFQTTMRRFGRTVNVAELAEELPLSAFFFDCLHDGGTLVARGGSERHDALARSVPEPMRVPRLVTSSAEAARAFYEAALAAGHEGVMAKSLGAPYEAGGRGASWLKIKRAHTLDLVVLAAEWGHGRRTGKLSNLHLGALDPATGEYVMLGKTFKGLTDAMLAWQTRALLERETRRDRHTVYVRPELVAEIAFSDLQASSRYPGGLALRLARVKRYRDDKRASEADTMEAVRRIFAAQGGQSGA